MKAARFALLLALLPAVVLAAGIPGLTETRIDLGNLSGPTVGSPVFGPHGLHVAFVVSGENGGVWVWVDGRQGPEYDDIEKGSLVFSADGRHQAYVGKKDGKCFVVVDGKQGPEYDIAYRPVFSPGGRHVVYIAKKGDKCALVVDGKEGPEYDGTAGAPVFSPDGKHVAYAAKEGHRWFVVVDGKEWPGYDGIGCGPVLSRDGKRVAYAVKKGGKWFVIVDGKEEPAYDGIGKDSLTFSPDGKRVAYAVKKGDKQLLVVDGREGPEYDSIGGDSLVFSSDGKRLAYAAKEGDKWFVVVDGKKGPEYDGIVPPGPVFSPDGKHAAYGAKKGDKWFVVVDGREGPEYDGIGCAPVFSPDSRHVAYAATSGHGDVVVVDGRQSPAYDVVVLGSSSKVVLGSESRPYDVVFNGGPYFHADGTLEWLAVRGGDLYRVTVRPPKQTAAVQAAPAAAPKQAAAPQAAPAQGPQSNANGEAQWAQVCRVDPSSLNSYLKAFPQGKHAAEAKLFLKLNARLSAIRAGKKKPLVALGLTHVRKGRSPRIPGLKGAWALVPLDTSGNGPLGLLLRMPDSKDWSSNTTDKKGWVGLTVVTDGELGVRGDLTGVLSMQNLGSPSIAALMYPGGDGSIWSFTTKDEKWSFFLGMRLKTRKNDTLYLGILKGIGVVYLGGTGWIRTSRGRVVSVP